MEYSRLVEAYEELEATQSTLEKTDILAELFEESGEELEHLVLLSMGRAFPYWKDLDLGISSKTMVKILEEASGASESEIQREWKELGDLGLAAEKVLDEKGGQLALVSQSITVERVSEQLHRVAEIEGSKNSSQDKKRREVVGLFNDSTPEEAKWIARTFIENLRLGVGEGLVRDALAETFFDGEHAEEIQRAYDVTNDFQVVARACREGLDGLNSLEIELFRPVKSMLAKKVDTIEEGFEEVGRPAAIDWKYDGIRCVSGYTPVYTEEDGAKAIRDVKVGDKVLTHKGNFKEVEEKLKRQIEPNERIFKVSSYLGNEFKITEGHEIRTSGGWKPVEDLENGDWLEFPRPDIEYDEDMPELLSFERKGGYNKEIGLTQEFWRFVGSWIGDGYSNRANGNQRVGLAFNEQSNNLQKYRNIINEVLQVPEEQIRSHSHNGGKTLYWTDPPLLRWLSQNFRKQDQSGWKDKKLPKWFWKLNLNEFSAFLEGWVDADGEREEDGEMKYVTTKERGLATTAQLIASKFGISCGIKRVRHKNETYYRLRFTRSNKYARISEDSIKVKLLRKEELSRRSPREVDPRQTLYDLQVEDDASYCTTTFALHNCQIHSKSDDVKIFTRRLDDITEQFPDVVRAVEEHVDADNFIIDSEIVGYSPEDGSAIPFQKLSRRVKRKYEIEKMIEKIPVEVRPFDLIYLEEPMIEQPYSERYSRLEKILEAEEQELRMVDHMVTGEDAEVAEVDQKAQSSGHEGIMMKSLDAEYKPGNRVGYMVKLKPVMETLDLAVIGAQWSEGRRSGWLGRLKLGVWNEEEQRYEMVGKMATGLTDEELQRITDMLEPLIVSEDGRDVEVRPEVILEVEYEEIQESPNYESGYALRFPRLKAFREDKEDSDTKQKLLDLYETQRD